MNKIARLKSESEKVIRVIEAYQDRVAPLSRANTSPTGRPLVTLNPLSA